MSRTRNLYTGRRLLITVLIVAGVCAGWSFRAFVITAKPGNSQYSTFAGFRLGMPVDSLRKRMALQPYKEENYTQTYLLTITKGNAPVMYGDTAERVELSFYSNKLYSARFIFHCITDTAGWVKNMRGEYGVQNSTYSASRQYNWYNDSTGYSLSTVMIGERSYRNDGTIEYTYQKDTTSKRWHPVVMLVDGKTYSLVGEFTPMPD